MLTHCHAPYFVTGRAVLGNCPGFPGWSKVCRVLQAFVHLYFLLSGGQGQLGELLLPGLRKPGDEGCVIFFIFYLSMGRAERAAFPERKLTSLSSFSYNPFGGRQFHGTAFSLRSLCVNVSGANGDNPFYNYLVKKKRDRLPTVFFSFMCRSYYLSIYLSICSGCCGNCNRGFRNLREVRRGKEFC